jgi:hypothetical protein
LQCLKSLKVNRSHCNLNIFVGAKRFSFVDRTFYFLSKRLSGKRKETEQRRNEKLVAVECDKNVYRLNVMCHAVHEIVSC